MASEHYHFTAGFNLAPDDHDLSVLFSGEGKPVPGHKMGPLFMITISFIQ